MPEEILTKRVKKVIHWGKGLALFVTTEAKAFGWSDKDHVVVSAVRDGREDYLVIKRLKI